MLLLGSQNLNEGEELIGAIKSVEVSAIRNQQGKEESVPVVTFDNAPPMALNITNTRTIASLYGERYDEWAGKAIQIYATKVKAFGVEQMALRVREAIPDTAEDITKYEKAIEGAKTLSALKKAFMSTPKHLKPRLVALKDSMKEQLDAQG